MNRIKVIPMAFKKSFGRSTANPRYGRDDDSGFRSRGSSSRRSSGRDSSFKPKMPLVDAICDKCGKPCQLPFKPTGEKPVYCRDCFSKSGSDDRGSRSDDRSSFRSRDRGSSSSERSSRDSSSRSSDLEEINEKLDKIMRALKIR